MTAAQKNHCLWFTIWLLFVAVSLWIKPFIPIDETRYMSVAWEMWQSGQFVVPHLNGEPYSHKPPLLFWLIHAGWSVFGVNDWWPRLIPSIFSLGSLLLTYKVALIFWPDREAHFAMIPLMMMSCLLWSIFSISVMFDMMVVFCVLLSLLGMIKVWRQQNKRGWMLVSLGIGLGILAKGPVVLVFILSVGLSAAWWHRTFNLDLKQWYLGLGISLLFGILLALLWVIPAVLIGGEQYAQEILITQHKDRAVSSFAHKRPVWWYLPVLFGAFFPWTFFPPMWRSFHVLKRYMQDSGVRFCVAWIVVPFIILSLISGKQVHYLLPLVPAFVLILSFVLLHAQTDRTRMLWGVGLIYVLFGGAMFVGTAVVDNPYFAQIATSKWFTNANLIPMTGVLIFIAAACMVVHRSQTIQKGITALAIFSMCLFLTAFSGIMQVIRPCYDIKDISQLIAKTMDQNIPIVFVGEYHSQYQYPGRLTKPLQEIQLSDTKQWVLDHPNGRIVTMINEPPQQSDEILLVRPYLRRYTVILSNDTIVKGPLPSFSKSKFDIEEILYEQ